QGAGRVAQGDLARPGLRAPRRRRRSVPDAHRAEGLRRLDHRLEALGPAAPGARRHVPSAGGAPRRRRHVKRLTFLPLVAATYFMVSGGPYGLEEIVAGAGYLGAILVLAVTPLVWSLPTALMIGELAAALPDEGGYYAWVKRALGPFWGFQEAWLSLVA